MQWVRCSNTVFTKHSVKPVTSFDYAMCDCADPIVISVKTLRLCEGCFHKASAVIAECRSVALSLS